MKIVFDHPADVRLEAKPGDSITVTVLTDPLKALLANQRLDGQFVARLVDDEEDADLDRGGMETATVRHGRRGRESRAAVS